MIDEMTATDRGAMAGYTVIFTAAIVSQLAVRVQLVVILRANSEWNGCATESDVALFWLHSIAAKATELKRTSKVRRIAENYQHRFLRCSRKRRRSKNW